MKVKHLTFKLLFSIFFLLGTYFFAKSQTDGFTIQSITSILKVAQDWEIDIPNKVEIEKILSQPYRYLGKGAQCYAFVSQDEKYVLKFFRYDHLGPPFASYIPLLKKPFEGKKQERRKRLQRLFTSCVIAFEELQNETGLLYLHLKKSENLPKLTLIDKINIAHSLDLSKYEFVLQKKADPVYPTLEHLIQTDMAKAKQAISELLQLIVLRSQKGIFDKDPDLRTNFGFINGKAVQIDVGRFRRDENRINKNVDKDELRRIAEPLHNWLSQKNIELAQFLNEQINIL